MTRRFAQVAALAGLAVFWSGCCASAPPERPRVRYVVKPASEWVSGDASDAAAAVSPEAPLLALGAAAGPDKVLAKFNGKQRKKAKTSIAPGSTKSFASVSALVAWLPEDPDMKLLNIPTGQDSGRVTQEEQNVRFPAWVYAIKWEADHDWHLIVGSDPDGADPVYFNVEISGLPGNSANSYAALLQARRELSELLDGDLPGGSDYYEYEPFPVTIKGSLFFDVSHAAGDVGPGSLKPDTAWEVHPVTSITWR